MARHHVLARLLDFCLPRACLLCGSSTRTPVCPACHHDLPTLNRPCCPICALPLGIAAAACGTCLKSPPAFAATQTTLCYAFPNDQLLQALKFNRRLAIAEFFTGRMLADTHPAGDVIMPVPLSRERLRARGFNQSLEIARPLAARTGIPLDYTSLYRPGDTPPQSLLPWQARRGNVRHAFACRRDLAGLRVIVVDDVMTTGATLDAVAQTLRDHGAARVINWVALRATRHHG